MCHLHMATHPCGCRDEIRIVVYDRVAAHIADARCLETLSRRRRRRRCCLCHQPVLTTLTTLTTSSHVVSPPCPTSEVVPGGSSASSSWEYRLPEYNVYGQYHTSYYSS